MTKNKIIKALLGASALTALSAGTAYADVDLSTPLEFTQAGASVENTFTLNYSVDGTPQDEINNEGGTPGDPDGPTIFTVDRIINLTVASEGDNNVAPGAVNEELVFSVHNTGNDTQAYDLSIVQEGGDDFNSDDPTAPSVELVYYIDDGDGVFQTDGTDGAAITYDPANPPELGSDEVLWVVVTQNIPTGQVDTDIADITLVADTLEPALLPNASANPNAGDPVAPDGGGNTIDGAAENVLADGSGTTNEGPNQGDHSATGTYIIATAELTAVKSVEIFSQDGSGCTTTTGTATAGAYAIPGACVEYVITVTNTGSDAASAIVIQDILKDELEFGAASFAGDFTGPPIFSPALPGNGDSCTGGACDINLTGAILPAPVSPATSTVGTVIIRATIK